VKAPKVSVIMPVFNGEQGIREAIDSILGQTYSDFEFLIVNDRSTDGSESIINEYARHDARIVLLHNGKEKGIVGALNTGLENARGEYLARMDADDISVPARFEKQLRFLEEHRDVVDDIFERVRDAVDRTLGGGMIEVNRAAARLVRAVYRAGWKARDEATRRTLVELLDRMRGEVEALGDAKTSA